MASQFSTLTAPSLFPNARVELVDAPVQVPETTISLDPGRTTGLVIAVGPRELKDRCNQCGRLYTERSCGPTHADAGQRRKAALGQWIVAEVVELPTLWQVLHTYKPRSILFERFDAENVAANNEALDIRGIVKLYRDLTLSPKIWWQPREVKKFSSDQMLKANGLWCRGMQHGRDAMRHLVWHLVKRHGETSFLEWTREVMPNA
jgi:hypothetical protein